ncbi:hypothetical protein C5167_043396 [Papaver somniferum]|uniref:Knottin scorpion toxin-like domain-containing protein n=1 Tax=Papaver somniferum TaxID=3469 RepID=A0A4Y7L828_PAPSO|nr:hypothetical protein C5167_043396 [Papaver somniferum]
MTGKMNVAVLLMCFMVLAVVVQFTQAHGDDGHDHYKVCFMKCFDSSKAKGLGNSLSEIQCDQMCNELEKFNKFDNIFKH